MSVSSPWTLRPTEGGCGGLAAAELKKKEEETEGRLETLEPDAERAGLEGGEGVWGTRWGSRCVEG